jgi:hypothetical protein
MRFINTGLTICREFARAGPHQNRAEGLSLNLCDARHDKIGNHTGRCAGSNEPRFTGYSLAAGKLPDIEIFYEI